MARELLFVIIFVILTVAEIGSDIINDNDEIPLSKSLGYAVKSKLNKNLEDVRLSREYQELYQEMLRASKESNEKMDEEEAKLETIIGKERAQMMKRGLIDKRLSVARMRSPVGRRRVRSQASRREKLKSQSLLSHQHHVLKALQAIEAPSEPEHRQLDYEQDY